MKFRSMVIFAAACAVLSGRGMERVNETSGKCEKVFPVEIVVESQTPLLKFAAAELQHFLHRAAGKQPPIVVRRSAGTFAIVLGDCPSAKRGGIEVGQLPPEGYFIRRAGDAVYLAGKDDPGLFPGKTWGETYCRGTLSAVYDFLERFTGTRFFFPGKYGTVVPRRNALFLPEKINIVERPDMKMRKISHSPKAGFPYQWYEASDLYDGVKGKNLELARLRFEETSIPFGHGLDYLKHIERFGKSHPEFFALKTDGTRDNRRDSGYSGQYCFNSGVREEIYQDAKAYFTGKSPDFRGIPGKFWNVNVANRNWFSVMPNDWLYWCGCEKCAALAEPGRGGVYRDPAQNQAASDFIWRFTSEIAERLAKEGIDGTITQMAYAPYNKVPAGRIAPNVLVQVVAGGIGGTGMDARKDKSVITAWSKALNQKVAVWAYAMGKHMNKKIPGVPAMMPRGVIRFIDDNQQWLDGIYYESETDYFLFNYLNYYVAAKKMWNSSMDGAALLDDHYRTMFGGGASRMRKFYEELESVWTEKILGNTVVTGVGPVAKIPGDWELWNEIYSPAKMKEFHALFNAAHKAASADPDAVERIEFIRKNMLGPLERQVEKFVRNQSALDLWHVNVPGEVHLRPLRGERNEVSTVVKVSKTPEHLVFSFDCEEPRMTDLVCDRNRRDDPALYRDSVVELMLNPSGDRKNYYHFVVNAAGALTDYRCAANEAPHIEWNNCASVSAEKRSGGWSATISVPWKELGTLAPGGMPVNFARHRVLRGKAPKETDYHWSPLSGSNGGFHSAMLWGELIFDRPAMPLVQNGGFGIKGRDGLPCDWSVWRETGDRREQLVRVDRNVFVGGGESLYFKNVPGKRIFATQTLPGLKPGAKYRLSLFLKTENVNGIHGASFHLVLAKGKVLYYPQVVGTHPWHRLIYEFSAPADAGTFRPTLTLSNGGGEGEVWFDEVVLEEVK